MKQLCSLTTCNVKFHATRSRKIYGAGVDTRTVYLDKVYLLKHVRSSQAGGAPLPQVIRHLNGCGQVSVILSCD